MRNLRLAAVIVALLWSHSANAADVAVRMLVCAPEAGTDELYVSLSIEGWPEGGRAIRKLADDLYAADLSLPTDTPIEYKFLRSKNWNSVEKDAQGGELSNRTLAIPRDTPPRTVLHAVARWADQADPPGRLAFVSIPGQPLRTESRITGRIDTLEGVDAPQLGNQRRVFVWLPENYDANPSERYAVLYLHDGQNLFDATTSAAGAEWGLDEAAARLQADGRMRRAILVGIANTPDRMKEYSPYPDRGFGGDADKYLAFLLETLKPRIDRAYRTLPDRANTFVGGSSMGGLVSLYAVLKHPDVFGGAAVMSPSLRWARWKILDAVETHEFRHPVRIWLDIGTAEGSRSSPDAEVTQAVADCRRLAEILRSKGLKDGESLAYEEAAGAIHHETAWATRADRVLQFLLPPQADKR